MIDSKYLDMLRKQPSIAEKVNGLLSDTIDKLITGAICHILEQPLPEELGFKEMHIGRNKLNNRRVIIGDTHDGRSVQVEFSEDFKKGYIAKRNFIGYEEVVLTEDTSNAAEALFDTIKQRLLVLSYAVLPDNPKLVALTEFLSKTRYGSNEYLCNEYLDIYRRIAIDMINQVDSEDVRESIREPLLSLEVTDIRQFLSDNRIDLDATDVHIIG